MKYDTLRKLYYKDRVGFEEEYLKRFNSDQSIHLDFMVGENPAFFLPTTEIIFMLTDILRIDKRVSKISGTLPQEALEQYSRKCLINEIVITNKIEGVRSTRREIQDVLDELQKQTEKKNKKLRFYGFVSQYLKLSSHDTVPLDSPKDVRELYDETVLSDIVKSNRKDTPDGKLFRKGQVSIVNEYGKELHNGFFPEEKIMIG